MRRFFFSFFLLMVVTGVFANFVIVPLIDLFIINYYQNSVYTYHDDLSKGTIYLLIEDLSRKPEQQWPQHIQYLQGYFGIPINLKHQSEIEITHEKKSQLFSNRIVFLGDPLDKIGIRMPDSQFVLILGPYPELGEDEQRVDNFLNMSGLVVAAIIALLWASLFWRRLKRIMAAAQAFGEGRLETRASVYRLSALGPLATAFNRMADRIQHLIDARRELTNAVSHELRSPISRIRFSHEMLGTATQVSARQHYLAEISKDIDELDNLVTESLTYARFDQGAPKLNWRTCLAQPWLSKIVSSAVKHRPQIELHFRNLLAQPNRKVRLDALHMGRAAGNLIQNAAIHAKRRVEVTLAEEGTDCLIQVDDDGPGIPEADRHRVFQAFTRLDTSRDRDTGGVGLGLAIVQRVVSWHDGRVDLSHSSLGGARFAIRWPGFTPDAAHPSEPL